MRDASFGQILSDEASTAGTVVGSGVSATLLLFLQNTLKQMLPLFFIALVVIIIDLIVGIKAARKRGEAIRISRAIRRTLGKTVEYFCWCVLASSLSVALELPVVEKVIVLLVIGIELISVVQNWCFARFGKRVRIDPVKIGTELLKSKTGVDVGGAVEVTDTDDIKKNDDEGKAL